jgi:hypothetical protein
MNWPPTIPHGPRAWMEFFAAIVNRIDATTPKDGHGARVVDAAGGGKSINTQAGDGAGVPLPGCVFYDSDGGEAESGEFFETTVYTNGQRIPIPPP